MEKVGIVPYADWTFVYWTEGKDIVRTLLDIDAKPVPTTRVYDKVFRNYFNTGNIEEMPPFKITGVTKNQYRLLMTLYKNWDSVLTYGELAKKAGFPNGGRFAGSCMAINPLPLIVPCHHVIGIKNAFKFTGDANIKKYMLTIERRMDDVWKKLKIKR